MAAMTDKQEAEIAYELGEMVAIGRRVARHYHDGSPDRILATLLVQLAEVIGLHKDNQLERCAMLAALAAGSFVHLVECLDDAIPGLIHKSRERLDALLDNERERGTDEVESPAK
jgi:hypothetical protein